MREGLARRQFRFLDLFAGIGGFHFALKALGGKCVLAVETDEACQEVYKRTFPGTPLVGDVRQLVKEGRVPAHDVLCAGFPCQPFSKSGAQLGLEDIDRGTLFFQIVKVIRLAQPRLVILENVRNIAGPRHTETWDLIIRTLWREGYRVSYTPLVLSPHLLPRSRGGRPQVRERIFILAERVGVDVPLSDRQAAPIIESGPATDWRPEHWQIDDFLQPDEAVRNVEAYRLRPDEQKWLRAWQDFLRIIPKDELPGFPVWEPAFLETPDLSRSLPEWKRDFNLKNSRLYLRHRRQIDEWRARHDISSFPESRRKFEWQARGEEPDLARLVIHFRPSGIRVRPPTYVPALVAITQTSVIGRLGRRITPREAARLQGFPERFRPHANPVIAYKQLGNAVNVGIAKFAARELFRVSGFARTRRPRHRSRSGKAPVQLLLP